MHDVQKSKSIKNKRDIFGISVDYFWHARASAQQSPALLSPSRFYGFGTQRAEVTTPLVLEKGDALTSCVVYTRTFACIKVCDFPRRLLFSVHLTGITVTFFSFNNLHPSMIRIRGCTGGHILGRTRGRCNQTQCHSLAFPLDIGAGRAEVAAPSAVKVGDTLTLRVNLA